jgi:hypothetical protein
MSTVVETPCRNDTCTRWSVTPYCSRDCQVSARNRGHCRTVRVEIGMDTLRLLAELATTANMAIADYVAMLVEQDVWGRP